MPTDGLPPSSLAVVSGKAVMIQRGQMGYLLLKDIDSPAAFAEAWNNGRDITPAQAAAMLYGSLFGWDTLAADPASYSGETARRLVYEISE